MCNSKIFPFEFTEFKGELKSSFIQNVEMTLTQDLQSEERFGCKIMDSHTHAGSKIHFKDFLEAELLFHNNYYNKGFAQLTVEEIFKKIEQRNSGENKVKKVILIGYESYSELLLDEIKALFEEEQRKQEEQSEQSEQAGNKISCDYCVYETHVRIKHKGQRETETVIRNIRAYEEGEFRVSYSLIDDSKNENEAEMKQNVLLDKSILPVFIVPINTTLSTMDKVISKFYDTIKVVKCEERKKITKNSLLLTLITIGPNDCKAKNIYWKKDDNFLKSIYKGFLELNCSPVACVESENGQCRLEGNDAKGDSIQIRNFAYVESEWMYCQTKLGEDGKDKPENKLCKECYPEKNKLKQEKPLFDVTRGSVVPMLQLEQKRHLVPLNVTGDEDFNKSANEMKKVWNISGFMSYRHIVKEGNHFQYFFDRSGFLDKYRDDIKEFLEEISNRNVTHTNNSKSKEEKKLVFNYIISPRQNGNARWVELVCRNVFKDTAQDSDFRHARTLYFEINREFRSNLKAKYSDFFHVIEMICQGNQESELRFHFVDETIVTGETFTRAMDLVHSLLSEIHPKYKDKVSISLFHSVFLIYGRASRDTRNFYMSLLEKTSLDDEEKKERLSRFYEYVHINVSSMRTHEDACILCKLSDDYRKIRRVSALNQTATICNRVIEEHKPSHIENLKWEKGSWKLDGYSFQCDEEKRLILLISHLLNKRLSINNSPLFEGEKKLQIDISGEKASEEIKVVLQDYYNNGSSWVQGDENNTKNTLYQIAFLKVISRPFFSFHLRKRQAAFTFLLEELEKKLKAIKDKDLKSDENKDIMEELPYINVLFKALTDLNANYVLRCPGGGRVKPFKKLWALAVKGDDLIKKENQIMREEFFSTEKFLHGIKKMIALSKDTTKTLLLETSLIYGNEDLFINGTGDSAPTQDLKAWVRKVELENSKIGMHLSILGKLYLENNLVIINAMQDLRRNPNPEEHNQADSNKNNSNHAYYLDGFFLMCYLNQKKIGDMGGELNVIAKTFLDLQTSMESFDTGQEYKLDKNIESWIRSFSKGNEQKGLPKLISFVRDANSKSDLLNFYTLSDDRELKKEFHKDSVQREIKELLDSHKEEDVVFSESKGLAIIKFSRSKIQRGESKKTDDPETKKENKTIYVLLQGFDLKNISHWFALKLIASRRDSFIKLIKRVNLPILIEERRQKFLNEALTISKAVAHMPSQLENFNFNNGDSSFKLENLKDEAVKNLYFRYWRVLSDILIANLYRKSLGVPQSSKVAILKENIIPVPEGDDENFKSELMNLFGLGGQGNSQENSFYYNYYDMEDKQYKTVGVQVNIINNNKAGVWDDCKGFSIGFLGHDSETEPKNTMMHLLIALIHNACKHSNLNVNEIIVEINLEQKETIVKNKVQIKGDEGKNQEENKMACSIIEEKNKKLEEELEIFPHLLERHSVTLWTLKHLPVSFGNTPWEVSCEYIIDGKDCYFKTGIKSITKELI